MAESLKRSVRLVVEVILRPYAQIIFSRDPRSGFLILAAIAVYPRLAAATVLAVAIAHAVTLGFGLGARAVREGVYACTAVLSALALGVFRPSGGDLSMLIVIAAALSVLVMASFEALFSSVALPAHSLPFIAATWITHLAARSMPAAEHAAPLLKPLWQAAPLEGAVWLDIPAALIFLSGPVVGLLLIAAIAVHSRIALLLGAVGVLVAAGLRLALRAEMPWSQTDVVASFNGVLVAMAIGGVWFVPQLASLLLGAAGAAIAVLLSYALVPATGLAFLPTLSLPFAVTTYLVLGAARRREVDQRPPSTIPDGRPEDALSRHLIRQRRFGNAAWLPFRLPFRGEWVVTQGYDGAFTHRGPWRHALDFEVLGEDGSIHRGDGRRLSDYHCYGLPVTAAGAGVVVKVADGIEDNPPGQVNTHDNWGNAVVVRHGPALHSVYAHLKPGSIGVRQGEFVSPGKEIGHCGNTGRSPVPHVHFQLQRTEPLGSPTIPADFGDVVQHDDGGYTVSSRVVPKQGDRVRPILRDTELAHALGFSPGSSFELCDEVTGRTERAHVEIDLRGRRLLKSPLAELQVDPYDGGFVVVDFIGTPSSLLRDVLVALARVPFDRALDLSWTESVPRRLLMPAGWRALADLAAMFAPDAGGITIHYRARRAGDRLIVSGQARHWTSVAEISLRGRPHVLSLNHQGTRRRITLRETSSADPNDSEASMAPVLTASRASEVRHDPA